MREDIYIFAEITRVFDFLESIPWEIHLNLYCYRNYNYINYK